MAILCCLQITGFCFCFFLQSGLAKTRGDGEEKVEAARSGSCWIRNKGGRMSASGNQADGTREGLFSPSPVLKRPYSCADSSSIQVHSRGLNFHSGAATRFVNQFPSSPPPLWASLYQCPSLFPKKLHKNRESCSPDLNSQCQATRKMKGDWSYLGETGRHQGCCATIFVWVLYCIWALFRPLWELSVTQCQPRPCVNPMCQVTSGRDTWAWVNSTQPNFKKKQTFFVVVFFKGSPKIRP